MYHLFKLTVLILLFSCSNIKEHKPPEQSQPKPYKENHVDIDTILERNAPALLDLTKHQLFIDTTRSSTFYKEILDWKPNEFDDQAVQYYCNEISKTIDLRKVDLKQFPRDWILLHSINNQFVAYNPINGIDWRFRLTDNSVNEYSIEADADKISKVISLKPDELVLELRTIPKKSTAHVMYLRIKKTKIAYLYSLQKSYTLDFETTNEIKLITPLENLTKFDLVVNHSPVLINSRVRFDSIKRTMLE